MAPIYYIYACTCYKAPSLFSTSNKLSIKSIDSIIIIQGTISLHGVKSKNSLKTRQTQHKALLLKSKSYKSEMAYQLIMNEAIMKAMAEATRVAIQAMAET